MAAMYQENSASSVIMSLTMTGMKGKHEKQEKPERKSERVMGKVMGDWQYTKGKSKQSKRKAIRTAAGEPLHRK